MGQKKKDPHQRLDTLERVSGWGTLVILAGIVLEIWLFFGLSEHDPREKFITLVANCLIALGLIMEYVAIRLTIVAAGEAKIEADAKVAEANARAAEAAKKAEEARERTARAELQLRKSISPRTPERETFLNQLRGKPPGKVQIMYDNDCADCEWAASWISAYLKDAQWELVFPFPMPIARVPDGAILSAPMTAGGQPWGITVVARDLDEPSCRALSSALRWSLEFEAVAGARREDMIPQGVLRIVVAPRA